MLKRRILCATLLFFLQVHVDVSIHAEKRFAYFYLFRTFYGDVCARYAATRTQLKCIMQASTRIEFEMVSCWRRRSRHQQSFFHIEINYGFYYSKWSDELRMVFRSSGCHAKNRNRWGTSMCVFISYFADLCSDRISVFCWVTHRVSTNRFAIAICHWQKS